MKLFTANIRLMTQTKLPTPHGLGTGLAAIARHVLVKAQLTSACWSAILRSPWQWTRTA